MQKITCFLHNLEIYYQNFSKTLRDIANAYIQEALRNQEDYAYKTEK